MNHMTKKALTYSEQLHLSVQYLHTHSKGLQLSRSWNFRIFLCIYMDQVSGHTWWKRLFIMYFLSNFALFYFSFFFKACNTWFWQCIGIHRRSHHVCKRKVYGENIHVKSLINKHLQTSCSFLAYKVAGWWWCYEIIKLFQKSRSPE